MGQVMKQWHSACEDRIRQGGCECGAVRYQLQLDPCVDDLRLPEAELSIRAPGFRLLSGEESISGHQFASGTVQHFYCEQCGVCTFTRHNVEQLGDDFYAVDVRWLDRPRAGWQFDNH